MMENRFREPEIESMEDDEPHLKYKEDGPEEPIEKEHISKPSLLSVLFSSDYLPKEKALAALPYFLFLSFLGVIYIANRHQAESKIRQLALDTKAVQELKWEYTGYQSKWMLATKQSQISQSVAGLALKESTIPPFIIRQEK